jgi:hypothetical protein
MTEHAMVDIDWRPGPQTLRRFGGVACLVFGALAYAIWRNGGHPALSLASGALACSAALCSLVRPEWNRTLYVGLSVLSYPIAWAVAWLLLLVLFFLVITPSALLYRHFVRARRPKHPSGSAWQPTRPARDPLSYFRQF